MTHRRWTPLLHNEFRARSPADRGTACSNSAPTKSAWHFLRRCPYLREFAATYVTAVCTRPGLVTERRNLHVPVSADSDLDQFVLSAPPMTGAEYLTAAVLSDLWQEVDRSFWDELSEADCEVEEFLKRRNLLFALRHLALRHSA
jgi:hypothetical protein